MPFRVIAGGEIVDTIQARPLQALVVEIHDSTGAPARGRLVRFEALPPDDPKRRNEAAILVSTLTSSQFVNFAVDVVDSLGRAKVFIALGTVAGTSRLRASVPELGLVDTVTFTVKPGAPKKFVIGTRDTTVQPNATYSLNASLADRFSNLVATETPTYAPWVGVTSVTPSGQVTVGAALARTYILVSWKGLTDTARVTIMPRLALVATRPVTQRMVVLVNTDGSGYTELVASSDFTLSPHTVKTTQNVVFFQGDANGNAPIWIVAPGGTTRALVNSTTGFQSAAWPRFSPDGQWVYFVGFRKFFSERSVWRIRMDGTQLDSVASVSNSSTYSAPSISPDGATAVVENNGSVKLIDVASKTVRTLTTPCGEPRYSPDGTRFACLKNGVVSVMNVDGTSLRTLASQLEDISGVDWSPDGAWLIGRGLSNPVLVNANDGMTISLSQIATYQQLSFVR